MDNVEKSYFTVVNFDPDKVQIRINDLQAFGIDHADKSLHIGSFIKIKDASMHSLIAIIRSFQVSDQTDQEQDSEGQAIGTGDSKIIITAQPIGQIKTDVDSSKHFIRGIKNISIPPQGVCLADVSDLQAMLSYSNSPDTFSFGKYETDIVDDGVNSTIENKRHISIELNGNRFFSKHIAILGSTGSGKSCAVATILQRVKSAGKNIDINNSHILIFDVHGEYAKAFKDADNLSVNQFDKNSEDLKIPYWLLNSEELEDLFIDNSEQSAYNQIQQFKTAVIENKRKWNPQMLHVDYDTPVFFSIREVFNYIVNLDTLTYYSKGDNSFFADKDNPNIKFDMSNFEYLFQKHSFYKKIASKSPDLGVKIESSRNGSYGQFVRFVSRFNAKFNDERMNFILHEPLSSELNGYVPETFFANTVKKYFGYLTDKTRNITIVDLSSLPFEVVSIIVSVISRLAFDLSYHQTKLCGQNNTPMLLVYEEAHKYIPKSEQSKYRNSREAVERIAKEGRKYGISEMIVSQRPSEISPTVLSQCNNFVVMKLTNRDDRNVVKSVLPDTDSYFADSLSSLNKREALVTGDAFINTCVIKIDEADPTPSSEDVKVYTEWSKVWQEMLFEESGKQIMKLTSNESHKQK